MNQIESRSVEPPPVLDFPVKKEKRAVEIFIIGIGFLILMPLISIHRVTDFMIFCIFALSFDLLYGYMGRLSFGHLLYLGTGAYVFGLFIKYFQTNALLAILLGVLAAGLLGMLLGPIMVRATGACFSLMALAFNQIGFFLVLSPLKHITNGEDGFGAHAQSIGFVNFSSKTTMFIVTLLLLLLVFYILKQLTTSPYGVLVRSIKEDENRVRFLGYNTYFYKWVTFVIASAVAGLAGTLTALNYNFVNPNVMDVHQNVGVVFACLIGGAGNLYGAVIGGVAYMMISNYLAIYIHRWEMFLGLSMLMIVFKFRKGIWGNIRDIGDYFRRPKEIRPAAQKGI
ncbi:MAG: ABC-type branched-chain amino acid transport system, permease component [Deltaproteobacteria bacterium]|nr:ABC-type branched-chain amino acid transport system, permease component [Deltaproteobacteria bacterium]